MVRVLEQAVRGAIDAGPTRSDRNGAEPGWRRNVRRGALGAGIDAFLRRKGEAVFALPGRTTGDGAGGLTGPKMDGIRGLSARLFVALQDRRQRELTTHKYSGADAHVVAGQQVDRIHRLA